MDKANKLHRTKTEGENANNLFSLVSESEGKKQQMLKQVLPLSNLYAQINCPALKTKVHYTQQSKTTRKDEATPSDKPQILKLKLL